jgi:hypothetical protein
MWTGEARAADTWIQLGVVVALPKLSAEGIPQHVLHPQDAPIQRPTAFPTMLPARLARCLGRRTIIAGAFSIVRVLCIDVRSVVPGSFVLRVRHVCGSHEATTLTPL